MKLLWGAIVASMFLAVGAAQAQTYSIDWYTIDGGGGTSSGGPYTLSGTIGQPDAGRLSGGSFVLDGGFWGGAIAVQQVGAPTLFIRNLGNGFAEISWDPPTPGFVLQVADTLDVPSPAWTNVPSGSTNPATVQISTITRFYRLHRP